MVQKLTPVLHFTSQFQLFELLKHETDSPAILFQNSETV